MSLPVLAWHNTIHSESVPTLQLVIPDLLGMFDQLTKPCFSGNFFLFGLPQLFDLFVIFHFLYV